MTLRGRVLSPWPSVGPNGSSGATGDVEPVWPDAARDSEAVTHPHERAGERDDERAPDQSISAQSSRDRAPARERIERSVNPSKRSEPDALELRGARESGSPKAESSAGEVRDFAAELRDLDERERIMAVTESTGISSPTAESGGLAPLSRGAGMRWWWWGVATAVVLIVAQQGLVITQKFADAPLTAGLQASILAILVVLASSAVLKGWRTRRLWVRFDRLREALRVALERNAPADREWFESFVHATRLARRAPETERRLRDAFHQGLSTRELCVLIDREVYAPIDDVMRRRVRTDAVGTGVFIAASPWIVADVLLVIWRNVRLLDAVADAYGWPPGARSRWVLARGVLRNIALAGVSEFAIHSLSTTLLSEVMGKLTARVAQGVAVGLYTARLGTFARMACRVTPVPDRAALQQDSDSIAREIRRSLSSATAPSADKP
ncbi:MAG: DUF697 domain-containing protein [Thioalkalivibrionaceae bacterium]